MQMNKATLQLEKGKILPLVLNLTIRAVVAQLLTFMYNIVDRIYVGMIPEDGTDALAALGIVLPITLILTAFANLVGQGGATEINRYLHQKGPLRFVAVLFVLRLLFKKFPDDWKYFYKFVTKICIRIDFFVTKSPRKPACVC